MSHIYFKCTILKKIKYEDSCLTYVSFSKVKFEDIIYNISKIIYILIKNSNLNNVDFHSCNIDEIEFVNSNCVNTFLFSSKILSVKGDIKNLKGVSLSMEQILDIIINFGIILHE